MTSTAHVICCNDSVEAVVLDDEAKAAAQLEILRQAYYARNKGTWHNEQHYRDVCYWHIHSVSVLSEDVGR